MAGQIDVYMATVATIIGLAASDRIRILATMSAKRVPQLPDVPTMAEAGLDGFVIPGWLGLFGPPNMSPQLRATVSKTVSDTVRDPRFAAKLSKISAEPITREAAEFAPFYYSELAKWKKFAEETHISAGN
jgi:tripartite-type tricarboxylate transporter receptor subunit TctC